MTYSNYSNFVRHFRNGALYPGKRRRFCVMSIIVQLGRAPAIGLRLGLRIRKSETGLKHTSVEICVNSSFLASFSSLRNLKEPDVLYMKSKYQDPVALTLSILFRAFQKGNAKRYAFIIRQQTAPGKQEQTEISLNSYKQSTEETYT